MDDYALDETSVPQTFFLMDPHLALKNKHGSSHPCSHKYSIRMMGTQN